MPPPLSAQHICEAATRIQKAPDHQPHEAVCRTSFDPANEISIKHVFTDQPARTNYRRNHQVNVRGRMSGFLARRETYVADRGFSERSKLKQRADRRRPPQRFKPADPVFFASSKPKVPASRIVVHQYGAAHSSLHGMANVVDQKLVAVLPSAYAFH